MANRIDFIAEAFTKAILSLPFPVKSATLCVKLDDDVVEMFGNMSSGDLEVLIDKLENGERDAHSFAGHN